MAGEHELWTHALTLDRDHGDRAFAYVVEQIVASVQAGDFAKIEYWRKVGERVGQLTAPDALQ